MINQNKRKDREMKKEAEDLSIFGQSIIKQCILKTFWQKCWGAWKVLTGEAGIILVRINPKNMMKSVKERTER